MRLSPHVAELLRAMAEDQGAPAWRVVELALLAGKGTMVITTTEPGTRVSNATIEGWNPIPPPAAPPAAGEGVVVTTTPSSPPPLPPEAQEIAQECAAFLEAQEDRAAALKVLRRAWMQALALTRLELRADP
ncbi:MAG: hypothetical protein P4L36_13135 [Holophaga sp.]|nr:hypothetical protein [Holophaga sp.]